MQSPRSLSENSARSPFGVSWLPFPALDSIFDYITDLSTLRRYKVVAPDLQQIVRQADEGPFALDLLQAAQAEAAETTRPLDLAEHRLHHPLRKPYTARPRSVRNFARIFSLAVATLACAANSCGTMLASSGA